jgi:hypothetical protein
MLFALIGFYRKGAEAQLLEISNEVNEFLGQPFLPPRLAAVLRDKVGNRVGNLVLIDAASFEDAEARWKDSPALKAGLYERSELARLDIEIGDLTSD